MLSSLAGISILLVALGSGAATHSPSQTEAQIKRCAAIADMVVSAYLASPDDLQRRTDRISKERPLLEERLNTTDLELMAAYAPVAFFHGRREGGDVTAADPINGLYLAAEAAASCVAVALHPDAA